MKFVVTIIVFLVAFNFVELSFSSDQATKTNQSSTCCYGRNGRDGRDGRDGLPGASGCGGLKGNQGDKGNDGMNGTKGDRGALGPQGPRGNQGSLGPQGTKGAQGPKGKQGALGPQGTKGDKGDQGVNGPQGPRGNQGALGPQGTKGAQGPKGKQGTLGPQGTKGDKGDQGVNGPQGPRGKQGVLGPQGTKGTQGPKGKQGALGPQETKGNQGVKGTCNQTALRTLEALIQYLQRDVQQLKMRVQLLSATCNIADSQPLGMENKTIKDDQIAASSVYSSHTWYQPYRARLNEPINGWAAGSKSANEWLQIRFLHPVIITAVATQGEYHNNEWVTSYQLAYSQNGANWNNYMEHGNVTVFTGNVDADSVVHHILNQPIRNVLFVRFLPKTWHGHVTMRVEVYGCPMQ